jgi:hypothetical protein
MIKRGIKIILITITCPIRLMSKTINSHRTKPNSGNKNNENKYTNSEGGLAPLYRVIEKNKPPKIKEITHETNVISIDLARKI